MHSNGNTGGVVALAGGVGGAKMAQGLAGTVGDRLTVVVNTADDFELWGLKISPDLDTVMYTLAGIADPAHGWGIAGDTHQTLAGIAAYGEEPWFSLGDRDFATHILRTKALREGASLAEVTAQLAQGLGISVPILPMTNAPVATIIQSQGEELEFQEYFVARRQADEVDGVRFAGIESAQAAPGVLQAIETASTVVLAPSNPIVSIGPILQTPGVRSALESTTATRIGVSPIIGGKALKGPADRMLTSLGHEATALGVARLYAGLVDIFVIDHADADLAESIRALGMEVCTLASIMGDQQDRERFAREVLAAAAQRANA